MLSDLKKKTKKTPKALKKTIKKHHRHGLLPAPATGASTHFTFYGVPVCQDTKQGRKVQPRSLDTKPRTHGMEHVDICGYMWIYVDCGTWWQLARKCGAQWLIQLPHPLLLHAPHTCYNAASAERNLDEPFRTISLPRHHNMSQKEGERFKHFKNI